jgi:hypothetical protein
MKTLRGAAVGMTLITALALSACETVSPYHPAASPRSTGFSEQRLEDNRFRLTFKGDSSTRRPEVEDYLLYRAAEVTLQGGFDYFVLSDRAMDAHSRLDAYPTFGPRFGPRFGYGPYSPYFGWSSFSPRFGWRGYYDPFWDDVSVRQITQYQATAEVQMFKGQKPADEPRAFDARQVQTNLQAKVMPAPRAS